MLFSVKNGDSPTGSTLIAIQLRLVDIYVEDISTKIFKRSFEALLPQNRTLGLNYLTITSCIKIFLVVEVRTLMQQPIFCQL